MLEEQSLFDYLTEEPERTHGATLTIISGASSVGTQFCVAFSGFGGIMRYKTALPSEFDDEFALEDEDDLDVFDF